MIEVLKPTEEELYPFKEKVGKLVNYAEGHVLNTPQALKKVTGNSQLTAYCFNGSTVIQMFSGYGDGLICYWEIDTNQLNQQTYRVNQLRPLIGHLNKINHLTYENGSLFSAS